MPRKGFPQISSMPSFRRHQHSASSSRYCENIPMRSIETENLKDLPPTLSPFAKRPVDDKSSPGHWTPISISSGSDGDDNEDEKQDKVGGKVL
jgi:hypothetical protein